jgi:hypothetical protein
MVSEGEAEVMDMQRTIEQLEATLEQQNNTDNKLSV